MIWLRALKVGSDPVPILRACGRYVAPLTDNGFYLRQGTLSSDLIRLVDGTSQPIQCCVEELLNPGCCQTNPVQRQQSKSHKSSKRSFGSPTTTAKSVDVTIILPGYGDRFAVRQG